MTKKNFLEYLEIETAKWPRRYVRYMFGSAGFFYGPKLFAFIMDSSFGIKVSEKDRKELLKISGRLPAGRQAKQFFNAGRPFGRWLEAPFPKSENDANKILPYFHKAYRFAKSKALR